MIVLEDSFLYPTEIENEQIWVDKVGDGGTENISDHFLGWIMSDFLYLPDHDITIKKLAKQILFQTSNYKF